jgi:peptidyl-Lys metalloendopeptidase
MLTIIVSGVYNFSTSGSGWYKLRARDIFYVVDEDNAVATLHAADNLQHEVHISGKLESNRRHWPSLSRLLDFMNCTSSQQSSVKSAAAAAKTYAANANSYFENGKIGTARYTTWFGPHAASRRDVVSAHFSAINSNNFGGFTYDCSCTDPNTFAYVYPSKYVHCILDYITRIHHLNRSFGYIHLCGAFWNAPTTGSDSKVGVLYLDIPS